MIASCWTMGCGMMFIADYGTRQTDFEFSDYEDADRIQQEFLVNPQPGYTNELQRLGAARAA